MCQPSLCYNFIVCFSAFLLIHDIICLFRLAGPLTCIYEECFMPCSCKQKKNAPAVATTDRYVTFDGIDCDGNARLLMSYIRKHIDLPEKTNKFWEYFKQKALGGNGPKPDDLFLIHSNLNQIRELFELYEDDEALALLDIVEIECC
jgi:hypothetical protein